MCTMYWNLKATVTAPCGHETTTELQTHFMGEMGSCMNLYAVGATIDELASYSGTLPEGDWLLGECNQCDTFFEVNAEIEDGKVMRLLEVRPAWVPAGG